MVDKGLRADLRTGAIDQIAISPDLFPFDAFEFDDPNRTARPNLTMKNPWNFKIGSENMPWTEEKHGTIPSNGWFAKFTDLNEIDLESELSTSIVSPSAEDLSNSPYGVNGYAEFTFTDFPVSFTNWTVIYNHNGTWQYKTSDGLSSGYNITETAGVIKLWSNLPFILPMITSYTSQSFREVLFVPTSLTMVEIENILGGADTFISYFTQTGANPSLTLSPQGLLWKSGDTFIRLGETASFHGVDLDSGNFKTGVQGWQISKEGNVEFNDGTFRGALDAASGTFNGSLVGVDGTFSGELIVTDETAKSVIIKDGLVSFLDETFSTDHEFKIRYNQILGTGGALVIETPISGYNLAYMSDVLGGHSLYTESAGSVHLGLNSKPWRNIYGTRLYLDDEADEGTPRTSGFAGIHGFRFNSGTTFNDVYDAINPMLVGIGAYHGVIGSYGGTDITKIYRTTTDMYFYDNSNTLKLSIADGSSSNILSNLFILVISDV